MILDPLMALTMQYFLASLFLVSSVHKAAARERFEANLSAYELVPASWAGALSTGLMVAELSIGLGLLFGPFAFESALGAVSILVLYCAAMALNLARGRRHIPCGCGVWSQAASLSSSHLVRNAMLIALAVLAALPRTERALSGFEITQIIAAVLSLGLLYLSVESLLAHPSHGLQRER